VGKQVVEKTGGNPRRICKIINFPQKFWKMHSLSPKLHNFCHPERVSRLLVGSRTQRNQRNQEFAVFIYKPSEPKITGIFVVRSPQTLSLVHPGP
jgi:hypothetical protein